MNLQHATLQKLAFHVEQLCLIILFSLCFSVYMCMYVRYALNYGCVPWMAQEGLPTEDINSFFAAEVVPEKQKAD